MGKILRCDVCEKEIDPDNPIDWFHIERATLSGYTSMYPNEWWVCSIKCLALIPPKVHA